MKFVAYMAASFITFFHIHLVLFCIIIYIYIYMVVCFDCFYLICKVWILILTTGWTVRGSNPGGARFSARPDRPWCPPSCTMGTGSFRGVKYGRGVLVTTQPLLVLRSWKSRAIPLPTLWATPRPATGTIYLYLLLYEFLLVSYVFFCYVYVFFIYLFI